MSMRYALRKQNKIASIYSEAYLKEHIISSLDSYFGNTSDERITDDISQEGYVTCTGEDYPLLRINDLTHTLTSVQILKEVRQKYTKQ